jgi:uncharacterized protein YbcI
VAEERLPGETLAAVSRELTRLKRELYGKGPEEVKAYQNDDFLFCVMRGGLTTVEQTLIQAREQPLVRQVRLRFQEQLRPQFVGAVERITGRRVLAYQSQVVFDPDYVVEFFLLGPAVEDQTGAVR